MASERAVLASLLASGLAIRVWLLPLPGYPVDIASFADWVRQLKSVPFDEFYGFAYPLCDYLPGYLYFLAAIGRLQQLLSASSEATNAQAWLKVPPVLGDLLLSFAVYRLLRPMVGARPALAGCSLVLFNPGVIFVSAVWGQVESVGTAYYVLSMASLVSGAPMSAAIWAGVGAATKPQYALPLVVAGLAYIKSSYAAYRREPSPRSAWTLARWIAHTIIAPLVVCVATVELLLLPFSTTTGLNPFAEWRMLDRVLSADIQDYTSAGAFNLWSGPLAGLRQPDSLQAWMSLSYQDWGFLLFAISLLPVLALAWRQPSSPSAVLWASAFAALAFFEAPTRMHERYLFPAIPLLAAGAVLARWMVPFFFAASALYLTNLWYVWGNDANLHANPMLVDGMSWFSVGVFAAAAILTGWLVLRAEPWSKQHTRASMWSDIQEEPPTPGVPAPVFTRTPTRVLALSHHTLGWMVVVAAVVGPLVGPTTEFLRGLGNPTSVETKVLAYRAWQDSGVTVNAGQTLSIAARGLWMHKADGVEPYGPAGIGSIDPKNILPSAPKGVLLARIGGSPPTVIGDAAVIKPDATGPLTFAMNDWPDGYHDNRGRVHVTVTIDSLEPPPTSP